MQNFSSTLKYLRLQNKQYQKDLAELLNITIRQYQRYESGEQEPNIAALITLADHFNVSLDYLVGRSNNQKQH